MMKALFAAVAALAAVGVAAAPGAHAQPVPPCAHFGTCQYMPNPYNGGPSNNVWDVPGIYGGWTNLPLLCDPATRRCRTVIPN